MFGFGFVFLEPAVSNKTNPILLHFTLVTFKIVLLLNCFYYNDNWKEYYFKINMTQVLWFILLAAN